MSLPCDDSAKGSWLDEKLDVYRRHLTRYWKKSYPHLAEDLAQLGVIQIWLKEVIRRTDRDDETVSKFVLSVGINKGRDGRRKDLRNQRDMKLGGQSLTHANTRMLQNPWRYEEAIIAFLDAQKDIDDQVDGRKKRRKPKR